VFVGFAFVVVVEVPFVVVVPAVSVRLLVTVVLSVISVGKSPVRVLVKASDSELLRPVSVILEA
jgi:hypothetical protein